MNPMLIPYAILMLGYLVMWVCGFCYMIRAKGEIFRLRMALVEADRAMAFKGWGTSHPARRAIDKAMKEGLHHVTR